MLILILPFTCFAQDTFEQIAAKAQKGNPAAQYVLGQIYWQNIGDGKVPYVLEPEFLASIKDADLGLDWIYKAAQNGYAPAQRDMGRAFFNADEYPEALYWFKLAAEQGDAIGQYRLGFMYQTGRGTEKDPQATALWYEKSAVGGYLLAQYIWGLMCYHGHNDVMPEYDAAFKWLLASAQQGYEPAQYCTAILYMHGRGVSANNVEALAWLKKAAAQADKDPYFYLLSSSYLDVDDLMHDNVKIYVWMQEVLADPQYADEVTPEESNFRYTLNEIDERLNDDQRAATLIILQNKGIEPQVAYPDNR